MATAAAKAARNREARQRLEAAFAALSQRLGIEVPPEPRRMKDIGLQPIVEIERFADVAEAVIAKLSGDKQPEDTKPTDTPPTGSVPPVPVADPAPDAAGDAPVVPARPAKPKGNAAKPQGF